MATEAVAETLLAIAEFADLTFHKMEPPVFRLAHLILITGNLFYYAMISSLIK